MTLSEKKGLITKPQVVRNDHGEVTSLNRGYMWRVMGHGWTHPSESWVSVDREDKGSLFHVYNVLTGAITHKPVYHESGHKPRQGRTLNFRTLDTRLKATHDLLMDVGTKATNAYARTIDGSIGIDDINDMKSFTKDMDILSDIPLFSEVIY